MDNYTKKLLEETAEKIYMKELRRMIWKEWTRPGLKGNDHLVLIGMASHFGLTEFARELKANLDQMCSIKNECMDEA